MHLILERPKADNNDRRICTSHEDYVHHMEMTCYNIFCRKWLLNQAWLSKRKTYYAPTRVLTVDSYVIEYYCDPLYVYTA